MDYENLRDLKVGSVVDGELPDTVLELLRHYPALTAELVDRWRKQVARGEREIRIVEENGTPGISTTLITQPI